MSMGGRQYGGSRAMMTKSPREMWRDPDIKEDEFDDYDPK